MPGIIMDELDHAETASWGKSVAAKAWREQQVEFIEEGNLRKAIEMDINDVIDKFGDKYLNHIDQYLKSLPEDLRAKIQV